jgi:putative addiction module CopG family antidote
MHALAAAVKRARRMGVLHCDARRAYARHMDDVTLPPDLAQFATDAVAAGRYRDVADVVAAGVSLLQRQEQARAAFITSLEHAEAEAERDGWHSLEDVLAEADVVIAALRDTV